MWPFEAPCQWYLQSLNNILSPPHTNLNDEQRREACSFIYRVSRHLRFPLRTCFTAQLYFHRFFARHPRKTDDYVAPMDIALTCLLVAAKAEETYLRIRQILAGAFLVLNPDWQQQQQQQGGQTREVLIVEEHRARVVQYEHRVLEAIEYNFVVRHAHEVLAKLVGTCNADAEATANADAADGSKISVAEASAAFALLQRIYETPLVLCYPPEIIAVSALKVVCPQEKVKRWIVRRMGLYGALKNDQLMIPLMTKLKEFAAMVREPKRPSSPLSSSTKDKSSSLESSRATKRNKSN